MRNPLRYQFSEYDCGPTAVLNALTYLFDREELPPGFLKEIVALGIDQCSPKGVYTRGGTSNEALHFMTQWLDLYGKTTGYPLHCEYLEGEEKVNFRERSRLKEALETGGCAVVRAYLGVDHYITLTGIDEHFVHVFDPYYAETDFCREESIRFVTDHLKEYNRLIAPDILDSGEMRLYSMKNSKGKAAALFFKTGEGKVPFPGGE